MLSFLSTLRRGSAVVAKSGMRRALNPIIPKKLLTSDGKFGASASRTAFSPSSVGPIPYYKMLGVLRTKPSLCRSLVIRLQKPRHTRFIACYFRLCFRIRSLNQTHITEGIEHYGIITQRLSRLRTPTLACS